MASSYVEVRESENGTEGSMLQFEINPCESNGIDVPSHIDGDPPKDHTYNKDPEVVQEITHVSTSEDVDEPEEKKESSSDVKKSSRIAKNTKQKAAKLRTVEKPVKPAIKKDPPRKTARIKFTAEKHETESKAEEKDKVPEEPQVNLSAKTDNVENESVSPVSSPVKKRNRKRKGDENSSEEVDAKKIKTADADSESDKVEVNADKKEEVKEEEEEEEEEKEKEVKESKPEKVERKSKVSKEKQQKPAKETRVKNSRKEKKEEPSKAVPKPKPAPAKKAAKGTGASDGSLPDGWTRKVVERKSGKTAGMVDIYIYSPDGIKFRSRPDIAAYLAKIKSNLKVEDFNFTKRGLTGSPVSATKPTVNKKKPASKVEEKTPPKVASKPKKKSSHGGSNSVGKRGQKILVKLNVTPKKRKLSESENQKGAKNLSLMKPSLLLQREQVVTGGKSSGTLDCGCGRLFHITISSVNKAEIYLHAVTVLSNC